MAVVRGGEDVRTCWRTRIDLPGRRGRDLVRTADAVVLDFPEVAGGLRTAPLERRDVQVFRTPRERHVPEAALAIISAHVPAPVVATGRQKGLGRARPQAARKDAGGDPRKEHHGPLQSLGRVHSHYVDRVERRQFADTAFVDMPHRPVGEEQNEALQSRRSNPLVYRLELRQQVAEGAQVVHGVRGPIVRLRAKLLEHVLENLLRVDPGAHAPRSLLPRDRTLIEFRPFPANPRQETSRVRALSQTAVRTETPYGGPDELPRFRRGQQLYPARVVVLGEVRPREKRKRRLHEPYLVVAEQSAGSRHDHRNTPAAESLGEGPSRAPNAPEENRHVAVVDAPLIPVSLGEGHAAERLDPVGDPFGFLGLRGKGLEDDVARIRQPFFKRPAGRRPPPRRRFLLEAGRDLAHGLVGDLHDGVSRAEVLL